MNKPESVLEDLGLCDSNGIPNPEQKMRSRVDKQKEKWMLALELSTERKTDKIGYCQRAENSVKYEGELSLIPLEQSLKA